MNERVQEIKKNVDFNYYWWFAANEGEPLCQDELDNVKELVKHAAYLLSEVERMQAENKAMKEALEWYANDKNYKLGHQTVLGERARTALSHLKGQ